MNSNLQVKTPKGGSEKFGEVSISVEKKIEFPPKVESMIKMSEKNPASPPPFFKDTDNVTTSKIIYAFLVGLV
jgi:hypothetical protein